jgi:carbamoyl-phosphate synthase large subunit
LTGNTVTVLLTGVGAPGTRGTIYALRKNGEGRRVKVIGTDLRSDAVGRFWVSGFHTVPPPEDEGYMDVINRICGISEVDVVIPQTTRETMTLSRNTRKVSVPVAVSGATAVRNANNKATLLAKFKELGLPFPRYFLVRRISDLSRRVMELGYPKLPVVVKPPVSFGSRGFRVLTERTSWDRKRFLSEKPAPSESTLHALEQVLGRDGGGGFPELLVTEYLPGAEYSVDAFVGKKGKVAIPRRRDEIVNGISFRTAVEPRQDIAFFTLKAATSIGLRYAFGFQFKLDAEGVPKVLECNPRVQGTMVASVFSGVNVIWMAAKEALGESPSIPALKLKTPTFQRFWGGVGFLGGQVLDEI